MWLYITAAIDFLTLWCSVKTTADFSCSRNFGCSKGTKESFYDTKSDGTTTGSSWI
jgi:hypothetical protein